jgi:hypothetical protein
MVAAADRRRPVDAGEELLYMVPVQCSRRLFEAEGLRQFETMQRMRQCAALEGIAKKPAYFADRVMKGASSQLWTATVEECVDRLRCDGRRLFSRREDARPAFPSRYLRGVIIMFSTQSKVVGDVEVQRVASRGRYADVLGTCPQRLQSSGHVDVDAGLVGSDEHQDSEVFILQRRDDLRLHALVVDQDVVGLDDASDGWARSKATAYDRCTLARRSQLSSFVRIP